MFKFGKKKGAPAADADANLPAVTEGEAAEGDAAAPKKKKLPILFIIAPWTAIFANQQPLVEGISYRPAQNAYDSFTTMVKQAAVVLPLVMARNLMAEEGSERLMLRALLTGGLIYSLPMLVEVRLSPQINVWVYGYFAHDFGQMMRYGGYRPMVFMTHGLWVALFTFSALIAAVFDTHLATAVPGLWVDSYDADGRPADTAAPACAARSASWAAWRAGLRRTCTMPATGPSGPTF